MNTRGIINESLGPHNLPELWAQSTNLLCASWQKMQVRPTYYILPKIYNIKKKGWTHGHLRVSVAPLVITFDFT